MDEVHNIVIDVGKVGERNTILTFVDSCTDEILSTVEVMLVRGQDGQAILDIGVNEDQVVYSEWLTEPVE